MTATTNRTARKSPGIEKRRRNAKVPANWEAELVKAADRIMRAIKPALMASWRARFASELGKNTLKIASGANAIGLADPAVKKFVVSIRSLIDKAANRVSFTMGQEPADDWSVSNSAVYDAIENAAIHLCETTKTWIEQATNQEAGKIIAEIRKNLMDSQKSGETLGSLTDRLSGFFDQSVRWKARQIARTEASRATNVGYIVGTSADPWVTGYEWLLSDDACDYCKAVGMIGGRPRRIKKGGIFAFDAEAPAVYQNVLCPPLHPNCFCTVVPIIEGDGIWIADDPYKGPISTPDVTSPIRTPELVTIPSKIESPEPIKEDARPEIKAPENETIEQAIERLRGEWLEVEKAADPKAIQGGPQDKMSDKIKRYTPGDAKIDAILRLAEKFPDHESQRGTGSLTNEQIQEIEEKVVALGIRREGESFAIFMANRTAEAASEAAHRHKEKVREAVFSLLEVEDSRKCEITSAPATAARFRTRVWKGYGYKDKTNAKLQKDFDIVAGRIAKATAQPNGVNQSKLAVACVEADKTVGAEYDAEIGVAAFGRIRNISTMAHEFGHAVSGGAIGGTTGIETKWKFCREVTKDKETVESAIQAVLKHGGDIIVTPDPKSERFGHSYAKSQSEYMRKTYPDGATEIPSVLLEYFYHDPIEFTRRMPREVTKLTLGFLDGTLR